MSSTRAYPILFRVMAILALSALSSLTGCSPSETEVPPPTEALTVFAAASTSDVLAKLGDLYTQRTGVRVRCSFASSSTLAKQIEAGAPADIYVSADPIWSEELENEGRLVRGTARELLSNDLVLIVPKGRGFEVRMEKDFDFAHAFEGRIALGDPEHVPAGRYAHEALDSLGWWKGIEDRVIPAIDVRDALRLVALSETDAGIVYATDAASTDRVEVIGTFPRESHRQVHYSVALVKDASAQAEGFVEFLFEPEAAAAFKAAGFKMIERP